MKISEKYVILIKNLYLWKQCGARRLLRELLNRIIHRDLQLKWFKRRRAQLLSEANRISHLTHW